MIMRASTIHNINFIYITPITYLAHTPEICLHTAYKINVVITVSGTYRKKCFNIAQKTKRANKGTQLKCTN